jgi:hypothetical protein
MAAFWELYMFHYILINSSWLRKRDAKRRSHQGSPRLERASDPAPPVRSNNGMPLSSEPR